ncbi:amino acid ABC transporter substrate-binding protein [Fructilactobacillus sanfranciscensis]|uniref:transporter substrate-binding domain-containing protein n=1 Tax=Fructilactobacillus sanfranciscensis TaxID=1625 RepID=UPI000D48C3FC|nr:transporter substrate-binding domain-containing protein [Fructilactobacillus sanfranciscensis]POH11357.1 amino acid ABC transporter substrate-binding protein [Fructilactobacillus sanfranciscensis]POH12685.1 amino acid ABC transporter substrate-binding protein [Fructilactobacillus sanfranciscensis]POH13855.1 amino acid ABC transporter substrate-binding protein [Fructilactobacillus sanfranciscensis]
MKKKLGLLLTIGLSALLLVACGNKSKQADTKTPGTLTIGMEGTYAPYAYRAKDGKLTGFEVELARDTAKRMGLKPKFVTTGWDSLIAGLGSNQYDVIFNDMWVNPARKKQFRYATPYIYSKSVLISKPGLKMSNLKGKTIAAGTGTENWTTAEKLGAKVVAAPDFQTDMGMINQGRADGAVNSEAAFNYWKKSHKDTGLTYQVIPYKYIKIEPIAPMLNKKSTKLTKEMNKALKAEQKDGTIKKLSLKYFGKDLMHE